MLFGFGGNVVDRGRFCCCAGGVEIEEREWLRGKKMDGGLLIE